MSVSDQAVTAYRDKLLVALRLREVPGDRIGEVLAEVEAHVAETGEDPVEAFGTPRRYADEVMRAIGGRRPWTMSPATAANVLLIAVASFAATSLTVGGLTRVLGEGGQRFGLGPVTQLGLGLAIAALVMTMLVRHTLRKDDPVVDPRTGESPSSPPEWVPPAVFTGVFALCVVGAVVLDRLTG